LKLGDKPLAEMTADELITAIETLQAEREALRAEAIAAKRKEAMPKEAKPRAPRGAPAADPFLLETLKYMKGDDDVSPSD